MNKEKPFRHNIKLFSALSLGFVILGIALICWSIANLWIHSKSILNNYNYADDFINEAANQDNTQIAVPTGQIKAAEEEAVPKTGKSLYSVQPKVGEYIGTLEIPALQQKLPIIHGTGDMELKKGVGHFAESVLPGDNDNSVLSGHRDTVFSKLGKLKIGDQFIVETTAGKFTYEIKNIRIVDKDDRTVIVPTDHAVLTVTTCYPFNYVGNAPERYILVSDLVKRN